jgi:branched-subunit amino acid transport protein
VLSAIIFPDLFTRSGELYLSLDNHRLLAGLVAVLTAWFTRNTLLTILVGMIAFFLLKVFSS